MACEVDCKRRPKDVELLSGGFVCSYCPLWAAECRRRDIEARIVLRIRSSEKIIAWVDGYEKIHGKVARTRLENCVRLMWPNRSEIIGELSSEWAERQKREDERAAFERNKRLKNRLREEE